MTQNHDLRIGLYKQSAPAANAVRPAFDFPRRLIFENPPDIGLQRLRQVVARHRAVGTQLERYPCLEEDFAAAAIGDRGYLQRDAVLGCPVQENIIVRRIEYAFFAPGVSVAAE